MRAWENYLKALEHDLGKATIDKWARSLKVLHFDAANLYLEASDSFSAQWFYEYIYPKARKSFVNENGRPVRIHLKTFQNQRSSEELTPPTTEPLVNPFIVDPLDSSYTLDRLVENSQNKIIYKLILEFEHYNPLAPPVYNPIYIYGPTGIGKSHLLQACAQLLIAQNIKVHYVKLATFMHNMVHAMKTSNMAAFRHFYRDCQVLIVDDIHELAQKSTTQEEFFHTFNSLHIDGKPIILSSQLSPQNLKHIEPRLVSRFEWGIVLPIKVPSPQELGKILDQKLNEVKTCLPEQIKAFLIETFSTSPQALSRALSALMLRAHLKQPQGSSLDPRLLTLEEVERLLSDLIKRESKDKITVDRILKQIADYFGVQVENILGKSQSRECALPRQISMYFCRQHLKMPYMKIGQIFSRDHSTVMSSVKQIEQKTTLSSSDTSKLIDSLNYKILNS